MDIFHCVKSDIKEILKKAGYYTYLPQGVSEIPFVVELPKDKNHGDLATNVAMVLARLANKSPSELAALIGQEIGKLAYIDKVNIAGPGFINLSIKDFAWQDIILDIFAQGLEYGNSNIGQGIKVNLEYVSANPTGPMHVGHTRGAVVGDALALLLRKCGFNVTKEYYINDAGSQIEVLARSAYLRYREACGENIAIPEGLYPGEYLIQVGIALKDKYGSSLLDKDENSWLPVMKEFTIKAMMMIIQEDLANLGIKHDIFTSEAELHEKGKIDQAFATLQNKDFIYKGVIEAPKGKKPDDWEEREQTLFRSTMFGDDMDRPLKKADGSWTYFGAELAYIKDKLDRGFALLILILGADHGGYVKRTEAAVKAYSDGQASADIKICQLVNLIKDGQQVKMSKRAGNYVTARDIVNMVGKDAVRFMMLTRKNDMVIDFDVDKVREQSKDNPVFYVQYAHARAKSVLRNALSEIPEAFSRLQGKKNLCLNKLTSNEEMQLLKLMASWPRLVESAGIAHEAHRVVFYLQDLAAMFHSLWNKGKENKDYRFLIKEDMDLTVARLALIEAFSIVLASGLFVVGVTPVEEM